MAKPEFLISLLFLLLALSAKPHTIEVNKGGKYPAIQDGVNAAAPGDVVLVRGGVYPESVIITVSGRKEAPLTIKAFPGEKVLMDGSSLLKGWKKCVSPDEAGGNPNWEKIWFTDAPAGSNRININLIQGDSILTIAQIPEASDPFYDEETREWYPTSADSGSFTRSSITDKVNLKGYGDDFFNGAFAKIVTGNNEVYIQKILKYTEKDHQIIFESLPGNIRMRPGSNRYALSNHPRLIDKPGKYYFDEANRRICIWPYDEQKINANVTATVRKEAFALKGLSYVTIEGFSIRRYYGKNINVNSADHIIIKNCSFKQGIIEKDGGIGPTIEMYRCNSSVVDGCSLEQNKHARGIIFNEGSGNTVQNCRIRKIGGTGVDFYYQKNSQMLSNDLRDCNGQHANGLTCYLQCKNILIKGNTVINCNCGLTYQEIDSMTVVNNVIHGGFASPPSACWNASNSINIFFYHNALIGCGSQHDAVYAQNGSIRNLVIKNNILDGMAIKSDVNISNNLYVNQSPKQHPAGPGDIIAIEKEKDIFKNYVHYDFHLKVGSPAINGGTNLKITDDLEGSKRPVGKAPDIGPYEWRGR